MFKGRLASCEVAYHSMIGEYRTRWDLTGGRLQIEAQVPANGVLEVELPDGRRTLLAGEHRLVVAELETT